MNKVVLISLCDLCDIWKVVGFLHHYNWPPWDNWMIVISGVQHKSSISMYVVNLCSFLYWVFCLSFLILLSSFCVNIVNNIAFVFRLPLRFSLCTYALVRRWIFTNLGVNCCKYYFCWAYKVQFIWI